MEADWKASSAQALVVGLGVNITPDAVPSPEEVRYPATSVAEAAGKPVNRWMLLADILRAMMEIRTYLSDETFIRQWQAHLAFRDEWVMFSNFEEVRQRVKILGINPDGQLLMKREDGKIVNVVSGEIVMAYN